MLVSLAAPASAFGQTEDLTVDVLVNSSNPLYYKVDAANPGEYQRYPERYLENLQMPYRVIDVSTTSPSNLNNVQLIIAGHKGLQLSSAWQQAIITAVASGVGFVNLDSDPAIGTQSHIQTIFGATGSTPGANAAEIIVPAAVQPGGATPHYIDGMQLHFPSDPPGDLIYKFHGDGIASYPTAAATDLTGAHGTVIATLYDTDHSLSDPLILATTYGKGNAVYFSTYDYLRADRFGFCLGVDDLFWRSLVWAARKPFVMRAYPRLWALQLDDNDEIDSLFATRIQHFWDTSLTGTLLPDGTGGPWKVETYIDADILDVGSGNSNADRDLLIRDIQTGYVKASPHRNTDVYGGDLYWNSSTGAWNDSGWSAALQVALAAQKGNGGSDAIPYSRSMVPEFFDLSNNTGYDMWTSLGLRYIVTIQTPGATYYSSTPKTPAERLPFRPFRIYEQPPAFGSQDETLPFFWADYYPVGSRAGQPSVNLFGFSSQILSDNFRFPGPDAKFPDFSGANSYSVANSLENFETYTWRFWSALTPVTLFTHDQNDYANTPDAERQQFVQQLSTWLNANGVIHTFVESEGDYLLARRTSTLVTGQATPSTITLNFTGQATDFDGNLIPTKALVFYGNDNGTWVNVPGFGAGGSTISFPNATPPAINLGTAALNFAAVPGSNAASQAVSISNSGGGTLSWFASSNASWLSVSPASGTNSGSFTASIASSTLAAGTYTTTIAVSALGATNSPQYVNVTLVVGPTAISNSPTSLSFQAYQNQGNPPPQTVTVTNSGGGQLTWTASPTVAWLTVAPATGGAPGAFTVSANTAGLGIGTFFGSVTISSPQSNNSPVTVPVVLNIIGVLLGDNFASGTLDGWAFSPLGLASNWSVSNGAVQYNGGGHTQIYAGDSAWTDYTVQASIKLASLANYPGGIRGRVNPVTGSSYAVWLYPNSSVINLYRTGGWNIDDGNVLLGSATLSLDASAAHTLALSMQGTQLGVLYDGKQIITATDATNTSGMIALDVSNQPISFTNINVTGSTASPGAFTPATSTLNFTGIAGAANPAPQSVPLAATGTGDVAWSSSTSAPWLTVSPLTGSTPATLQVSTSTAGLAAGVYNGTINLVSLGANNSPQTISVVLTVNSPIPVLAVSPVSLNFSAAVNGASPVGQQVAISTSNVAHWTASSDSPWLSVSPASGTSPAALQVSVNPGSLAVGTYNGNVTVTSPGLSGSPAVIPVTFTVYGVYTVDNFSNGLAGWAISPLGNAAGWSVAALGNGENGAQYNGQGATQLYAGNTAWADYSVQADVQLSSLNNFPGGIRGRVQSNGGGYTVWLYPGSSQIALYRVGQWDINQGFVSLGTAPLVLDATQPHTVQLSMQGSQISVLYDGQQVITATDPTYTSGMIALDVSNQPIGFGNVTVASLNGTASTFAPAPTSLTFNYTALSGPGTQSAQVGVSSGGAVFTAASNAAWLTATSSTSVGPATLQVTADPTGMAPGTYTGAIALSSMGAINSPQTLSVQMIISATTPTLSVSPGTLSFNTGAGGSNPVAQSLSVLTTTPSAWTAASDSSWLTVSPASGSGSKTLQVNANPAGLAPGTYSGNVTVTAPGLVGSPATIPVTFNVYGVYSVDKFTGGLAGWVYSPLGSPSGWSAVTLPNGEGAAQYNGAGANQIFAGSSTWTDYSVQADVQLSNLLNFPGGLRGRVQANGAGYAVWLYPATQQIILYSVGQWDINQGYATLGTATQALDTSKPHTVQLSMQGSQISVFYDGQQIITAADTTYTSGMIALEGSTQPVAFGNVTVASINGMLGTFAPSPSSLTFAYTTGGTAPAAQTVSLAPNAGSVAYTASSSATWLSLSPASGTAPAALQVTADPTGLAVGTYNGSITLSSLGAGNSPQTIAAQLTVTAPPAILSLSQTAMNFAVVDNGSAPATQPLTVTSTSATPANWTATSDSAWLTVPTTSQSTPATVQVAANPAGLVAGTYTGHITINAPGAVGSPATVTVTFILYGTYSVDNFSNGLAGFVSSPVGSAAGWSAVTLANGEGAAQYNGSGANQIYAGSSAWDNYSVQADVQLSTLSNFPGGLRGRVQATTGAGYAVWLYPATQQILLARVGQWDLTKGSTTLGTAPLVFDTSKPHVVQLSMQGSQIRVSYDGQQVITATDTTYPTGMIALEGSTQPAAFGNVTIASINGVLGTFAPSPASLTYTYTTGGTVPAAQTVTLTPNPGTMAYTATSSASWLTLSPASGTAPVALHVTANPTGLAAGTYNGSITLTSLGASNTPQTITAKLTVTAPPAVLSLSPTTMTFNAQASGAAPATQPLTVSSTSSTPATWTAKSDSTWLTVPTTSQSTPATIQVAVTPGTLAAGTYTGHVTITAPGATGSPATVTVTFNVYGIYSVDSFTNGLAGFAYSSLGNASGWSSVTLANGQHAAQYNGQGAAQIYGGNSGWANYSVQADVQLTNLLNSPGGLRGRVQTSGAGYAVSLNPASRQLVLSRVSQWSTTFGSTTLGTATITFDTSKAHTIKLNMQTHALTVFYDGAQVISATDSTYASGMIALEGSTRPIAFSNVIVVSTTPVAGSLTFSPASLTFTGRARGTAPAAQTLNVTSNSTGKVLAFSTSSPVTWLTISPLYGTTSSALRVTPSTTGLAAGTYKTTLLFYSIGDPLSPKSVNVTLTVTP